MLINTHYYTSNDTTTSSPLRPHSTTSGGSGGISINGIHVLSSQIHFMITRSGATYKAMEDQGSHVEETPAESHGTTGGTLLELASLTEMMRVMIEDQE